MTLLAEFQQYINNKKSPLIARTRLTWCTYKHRGNMVREQRLWIYFAGYTSPRLVKEDWITPDFRSELVKIFKEWARI